MAYAAVTDIGAEFKGVTFSASTVPTTTQVSGFIDQASAKIDGRVGNRYVTPVTGTTSLLILKEICTRLVVPRVREIMATKGPTPQTSQDARGVVTPEAQAQKDLEDIANGLLKLPDATEVSSGQGVASFNVSSGQEHTFQKGVAQW